MIALQTFGLLVGLLHLVGGLLASVWLVFKGEWWALGAGLLALVLARFVIAAALIPGMWLFGIPAAVLERGGRQRLARPFHALVGANTVLVMTAWCFAVAWFYLSRAAPDTRLPLLILSYSVALGPWIGLAAKDTAKDVKEGLEPSSVSAQTVTFFMQLAYLTAGVAWFFGWARFQLAFLPLMTVALMLMGELTLRRSRPGRLRRPSVVAASPGAETVEGEGRVSPRDSTGS